MREGLAVSRRLVANACGAPSRFGSNHHYILVCGCRAPRPRLARSWARGRLGARGIAPVVSAGTFARPLRRSHALRSHACLDAAPSAPGKSMDAACTVYTEPSCRLTARRSLAILPDAQARFRCQRQPVPMPPRGARGSKGRPASRGGELPQDFSPPSLSQHGGFFFRHPRHVLHGVVPGKDEKEV